jgi:phosphopantetheinyl transferase (holo-ACP synthase)
MSQSNQLSEILTTLLMLAPGELKPETSLKSLDSSLGTARLALALKRAGLRLPGDAVPPTFRDLELALDGNTKAPASSETVRVPGTTPVSDSFGGLQVGLDVQEIGALPLADDYWDHEFYKENFDKSEIAYAVVKPEPRIHLAGFWCAKEALRKCDPAFALTSFASTAVMHDADGKPWLLSVTPTARVRLPHALSVSHSGPIASAVVVTGSARPVPPSPPLPAAGKPESRPVSQPQSSRTAGFAVVAGVLVLVAIIAILAFVRY